MKKMKSIITTKAIAAIFLLLSLQIRISAQNPLQNHVKLGGGVEQYVSGNIHGTVYSPYLALSKGKNVFTMGAVIQKRSLLMQGGKIGYQRVITGGDRFAVDCDGERVDERLQLNAFGYIQYVKNMSMSYTSTIIEERTNKKMDYNWNQLRLSTAELCAGVELHIKINQNISWKNYFGASVYYHLNYKQGMYHERILPVLLIGTGINIKHF